MTDTPPAPKTKEQPIPEGFARVRITKMGHDQVFTGETRRTKGANGDVFNSPDPFPRHAKDDTPIFPLDVAEALEKRGFAEIQD